MRLEKIQSLSRKEILYILKIISPEEVFPYRSATMESLQEMFYSSLSYLVAGEPLDISEVELRFYSRLSVLLGTGEHQDPEKWSEMLFCALGEMVLSELKPVLEVAKFMAWADGRFVSNELAVFDVIFSQLKLLRNYKKSIVDICMNPMPAATLKADLAPYRTNSTKSEMLLAFAWAIAMVDLETHETEIKAYDSLALMLDITDDLKQSVKDKVTKNWISLSADKKTSDKSRLVVLSSGMDEYIKQMIGMDVYQVFTGVSGESDYSTVDFEEKFNSLTLFSKISMLCRPELTLLDRIVLMLAMILAEK